MNDENDRLRLPITILMNDGRERAGDLIVNLGGTLERTLNSDAKFILFSGVDQVEMLISKSAITEVQQRKATKPVALPDGEKANQSSPYALLGIPNTATDAEIREAYLLKAKAYHADRFANIDMPKEVQDYTNSMSRRINEAYALLAPKKDDEQDIINRPAA